MPPADPSVRDHALRERQLAERVRGAVLQAVAEGFEEASMSGLCAEGAIESSIGRARSLDLTPLLQPTNTLIKGSEPLQQVLPLDRGSPRRGRG